MSLITRCPACDTLFKVVPDQLRISDGWVRCGQCDEVFDANAHLQSDESIAPVEPETPVAYDWGTIVDSAASTDPEPAQEPEPELEPQAVPDPVLDAADTEDPFLAMSPQALGGTSPAEAAAVEAMDPMDVVPGEEVEPEPRFVQAVKPVGADAAAISFMYGKPPVEAGASRRARVIVVGACCVLAAVLGLQWLVQDRDRIAVTDPVARQVVDAVCAVVGCKISPLRQIESVVIDSSSFAKVRTDVYRLGFTLKNTAPIELAVPSLELTMTDMQDQALVRRVFSPAELESKGASIAAGAEWTVSVPVAVKLSSDTERISGYRLLAFYP
jgi:predicted Zn finger-like uncharacterized protein